MNVCKRCLLSRMSAEAFQNIKENIELIPDEKKAVEALYKKRLEICTECDCLINGMCSKCGCFCGDEGGFRCQPMSARKQALVSERKKCNG